MKHKVNKKKKSPAKKTSKKRLPKSKSTVNPNSMALVTIPYQEIQKPETYKGKLSVIPTPFNERQLGRMIAPTPTNIILQRKGKGGKNWDYIPTWWFKKQLNFTFGWMWDFDILDQRIDGEFITVKGKLTIKNAKGEVMINKTDFGGHPITFLKDQKHSPENYLDISNDFKAGASDCLKRCCVQLGFGLDVYSKTDYKTDNGNLLPAEQQVPKDFKHGDNITVVKPVTSSVVDGKVVQTDYKAKLDKYLMEHPKEGPMSNNEKIRFIKKYTGKVYDYSKITQVEAQIIIATLTRNYK